MIPKFRAWDKANKEMVNVLEMKFLFESEEGIWIKGYSNNRIDHEIFPENLILMQFTGLLDKNGKEIFGRDICKVYDSGIIDYSDPNPYRRVIKWDENIGGFSCFRLDGEVGGSGWTFCRSNLEKHYEVIGNELENPELLEERNQIKPSEVQTKNMRGVGGGLLDEKNH